MPDHNRDNNCNPSSSDRVLSTGLVSIFLGRFHFFGANFKAERAQRVEADVLLTSILSRNGYVADKEASSADIRGRQNTGEHLRLRSP